VGVIPEVPQEVVSFEEDELMEEGPYRLEEVLVEVQMQLRAQEVLKDPKEAPQKVVVQELEVQEEGRQDHAGVGHHDWEVVDYLEDLAKEEVLVW
jgi:hypothetical protein